MPQPWPILCANPYRIDYKSKILGIISFSAQVLSSFPSILSARFLKISLPEKLQQSGARLAGVSGAGADGRALTEFLD